MSYNGMMEIPREVVRTFVSWIKVKISTHVLERQVLFNEGEIWWVSIGQNVGVESNGKNKKFERPVLVLKKFSKNSFWGISISSVKKEGTYYHSLILSNVFYSFNLSQLRVLSSKRLLRRMTRVPQEEFITIKHLVAKILI